MAESAFNFEGAPNGNMRQFGVLAGALGLRAGKKAGPSSMSAKDQSALMAQQHAHNLELESHRGDIAQRNATMSSVVGHVVGQEASKQAHKQTMAQNRLANKHDMQKDYQQRLFAGSEAEANRAHQTKIAGAAYEASSNPNIRSFNANTGSFTTTHPMQSGQQFDGVGEE